MGKHQKRRLKIEQVAVKEQTDFAQKNPYKRATVSRSSLLFKFPILTDFFWRPSRAQRAVYGHTTLMLNDYIIFSRATCTDKPKFMGKHMHAVRLINTQNIELNNTFICLYMHIEAECEGDSHSIIL